MITSLYMRIIAVPLFIALGSFAASQFAGAASHTAIGVTLPNPLAVNTFFELIESLIQLIFIAGIAVSPVFVIWGGFMFITAAGDARKVTSATNILKYTFVGILIIVFARAIVFIIKNVIGG